VAALAVPEAPLTEEPVVATPVAGEAPAVETPVIPLATGETPVAVSVAEAAFVTDAPEVAVPDSAPVAVAGRLAVPVSDTPEFTADAVPDTVGETVFGIPDNDADSVPVAPRVLLSPEDPDKVGSTEPSVPVGTEPVDDKIVEGPKTMLPLDPALAPDVGRRPETSDTAEDTAGNIVLLPTATGPDEPKIMLEPNEETAVGAAAFEADAGWAVAGFNIELRPVGPSRVGLTLGSITIGGTPLLEAELVVCPTTPLVIGDKMLPTDGILGKMP